MQSLDEPRCPYILPDAPILLSRRDMGSIRRPVCPIKTADRSSRSGRRTTAAGSLAWTDEQRHAVLRTDLTGRQGWWARSIQPRERQWRWHRRGW